MSISVHQIIAQDSDRKKYPNESGDRFTMGENTSHRQTFTFS